MRRTRRLTHLPPSAPARWHRAWHLAPARRLCCPAPPCRRVRRPPRRPIRPTASPASARSSARSGCTTPDADEWIGVARNRPLTTGDRLATDNDARAEITLGSTTLRLDAATELEIVLLDDDRFALQLHRGSVAARVAQRLAPCPSSS